MGTRSMLALASLRIASSARSSVMALARVSLETALSTSASISSGAKGSVSAMAKRATGEPVSRRSTRAEASTTAAATAAPGSAGQLALPFLPTGANRLCSGFRDRDRIVPGDLLEPFVKCGAPLVSLDEGDHVIAHRHSRPIGAAPQLAMEP